MRSTSDESGYEDLRVLYVTSHVTPYQSGFALRRLAAALHGNRHAFMVATPDRSLSEADMAGADELGVEYVYLGTLAKGGPLNTSRLPLILKRFRPHIVHVGADVPLVTADRVIRIACRSDQAIVMSCDSALESAMSPQGAEDLRRLEANIGLMIFQQYENPQFRAIATASPGDAPDAATRGWDTEVAPILAGSQAPTEQTGLVDLGDEADASAHAATLRALSPMLAHYPTMTYTLLCHSHCAPAEMLRDVPAGLHSRIHIVRHVSDWLKAAMTATIAVAGPASAISESLLGLALLTNLRIVAPYVALAQTHFADCPSLRLVQGGLSDGFCDAVEQSVQIALGMRADPNQWAEGLHWMYHGLRLVMGSPFSTQASREGKTALTALRAAQLLPLKYAQSGG